MTTPEAAPGWYGDPAGARVLRWWNGQEWTDDIAARGYEPLPSDLLEKERQWATRAHYALIGVVLLQILLAVLYIWFVRRIVDEIDAAIDSDGDDTVVFGSEGLLLQLVGLASIGLWVLVYLWVYAAATFGRAAGLPARRDPGLAVASFGGGSSIWRRRSASFSRWDLRSSPGQPGTSSRWALLRRPRSQWLSSGKR